MTSTERDTLLLQRLRHVGRKLLKCKPYDDIDVVLEQLDKLELILSTVDQRPANHVQESLVPLMKALISAELLRHPDEDVKISVTSCLAEITRITAPDSPYDDEQMKEVFKLKVSAFEKLCHVSGRGYEKALAILENVWKVRSSLVMLDLECDDLVIEMFHHFFGVVRSSHPSNVIHSMESIMTLVINESDEISPDLLKPLLDSARKENQTISPISWTLAEKVITSCAVKLTPFLMKAVESSGRSLHDYPQIVSSICQNRLIASPKAVVQSVDNKLDVPTDADDQPCDVTKGLEPDTTCVRGSQLTGVTKSNISASAATVDGEAIKKSGSKRKQHSNLTKNSKRSSANSNSETCNLESVKEPSSETRLNTSPRRRDNKPNSLMNAEEVYDHSLIHMGTKTRKSAQSRKAHNTSSVSSPPKNPMSRKDMMQPEPKTKHVALVSEPRHENIAKPAQLRKTSAIGSDFLPSEIPASSKDNVLSKSADMSEGVKSLVAKPKNDENTDASLRFTHDKDGSRPKRGRPRKISSTGNQDVHTSSVSISKKGNLNPLLDKTLPKSPDVGLEKESDEKPQPPIRKIKFTLKSNGGTCVAPELVDANVEPKVSCEDEGRNKSAMNVEVENREEARSSGQPEVKKRRRHDDATPNKGLNKSSAVKGPMAITESASKALSGVEETTQSRLRRRNVTTSVEVSESRDRSNSLVGSRIEVWWPKDKTFYAGVVASYDPVRGKHKILYDDGDEEVLNLNKQRWKLVDVSPNEEKGLGLKDLAEASDMVEKCRETPELESAKGAKTNSQSRKDSASKPPKT
ncbi:sister chromatid cohesion protein PDS5 homolog C-like [Lotus japonicus]|uniref:sister chromatid cohesion protein PDS5 homolog C-like n=1 Tax=Lotus japonicus TaxID=34305 RepID=UPI0025873418|nr:sister chromatid cohesion protein PDS5 homolog C-like [Lotus japonicus]